MRRFHAVLLVLPSLLSVACGSASSSDLEPVVVVAAPDAGASVAAPSGDNGGSGSSSGVAVTPPAGETPAASNCSDAAKLVYLVSKQKELWSFNPTLTGTAAYRRVGALGCATTSAPQTMGVDRTGSAWIFYSDGSLHKADTSTARCTPAGYTYPGVDAFLGLGMGSGFTALGGDITKETLFLLHETDGLETFETRAFARRETGALTSTMGELTGGPDGRLFVFNPGSTPRLSEINTQTLALSTVKSFSSSLFSGVRSFALARYAGSFFMFTAGTAADGFSAGMTKVTVYDPARDAIAVRDADVGFTVVGAGQSVCVPPPAIR